MTLRFYDTLTRSLRTFSPLEEGKVRFYGCGPTIYGEAHAGNYRSFIAYDLVHRYLEWKGYDVFFVMNLTDVDDKTIDAAFERGVGIAEYTAPYARAFLEGADALGMRRADDYPRATHYVGEMIQWIERLEKRGLAYATEDGSVYFDISSFPGYGKLSGMDPGAVRSGARVDVDEYAKDDARDFALWKSAKGKDRTVGAAWNSPWGRGRPGWHLECSVMSIAGLGETLDIHMGGEDLIFPHHEDEIAQAEGATGRPFVRYWLHVKHLLLDSSKMSKSLGNVVTVPSLLGEGYDPAAIRHRLISAHYRRELNFTRDGLEASARAVQRLLDFEGRLRSTEARPHVPATRIPSLAEECRARFEEVMDDDVNSPEGLGVLFTYVTRVNAELDRVGSSLRPEERSEALAALHSVDEVLGLLEVAHRSGGLDREVEAWIEERVEAREEARRKRDYATADKIRDELAAEGIALEDSVEGTHWKVVR